MADDLCCEHCVGDFDNVVTKSDLEDAISELRDTISDMKHEIEALREEC